MVIEAKREQVPVEWNDTATNYPRAATIQELFDVQVALRPHAVALEYGERQITYAELQGRANQLAHYLRRCNTSPGDIVAVCAERSIRMIVALLAILKAGAAYVPLDPSYPRDRLAFMLEDTQVTFLIAHEHLLERLPVTRPIKTICLDRERELITQEHVSSPPAVSTAEDLAYIMYTSGSTGQPNGVTIPHRAVVRLVWSPNYVTFHPEDVLLQFAPISFDASTFEIWGALLNGCKLAIFSGHTLSLGDLATAIRRHRVTTLWLTAGLFHLMVDHHLPSLGGVRQLLAGGDVLSLSHVRRAVSELKECRVINGYGPTENTTFTCCHHITLDTIGASVPIGQPISNTRVYVLDDQRQQVPIGEVGELYVGGDGLARGYLNRPQLTAERFIEIDGLGRLYRTGDRCRWRPDGLIEFLGRTDDQVKLRGQRVELGEIEATLNRHPAVALGLVIVHQNQPDVKRLVAYVVPQNNKAPTSEELRAYLKNSLPEFMVPSAVMILDSVPLTPNGKIDRAALPMPQIIHAHCQELTGRLPQEAFHPRDDLERALFAIWKRVLGISSCHMSDNLLELGSDSLLLARLATLIEEQFKKAVPLSLLLQSATIEKIAAFLRQEPVSKPNYFVPFNETGSRPAFFCVHCVTGEVMIFRHIAKHLDADQRFYGIQWPSELRRTELVSSVEEIASRYVDALLDSEPQGPYTLGGYSAGASVALEMAQQLQAKGREVRLLVAIDDAPENTGYQPNRCSWPYLWKLICNFPRWVVDDVAADFTWQRFPRRLARSWSSPIKRAIAASRGDQELANYELTRILLNGEYPENMQRFIGAFYQVLQKYVPKRYSGPVVLYTAKTQPPFSLAEPDRAWSMIATDLEVVRVNGTHVKLFEPPGVCQLAKHLNTRLRECRTRALAATPHYI